ncbi:MAG: YicC family protein [Nitrospirae bacterium]|nr:YicC family protein [Nitrospirota bacterium]
MAQSMTGFGSALNEDFLVEIRSLNHRFIDISIKMPPSMNEHEIILRNIIKERFKRGRFDVSITFANNKTPVLKINKELAKEIYNAYRELQKEFSIGGEIGIEILTNYKDIIMEEIQEYKTENLLTAFQEALSDIETMRKREGDLLHDEMKKRVKLLMKMNDDVKKIADTEVVKWKDKFTDRLKLIIDERMIDHERIIQEAAIMADKLDISEELNRIENHLKQFLEVMNNDNSIGKKLEFILQEISREVNTIGYKSGDYAISTLVIEMKAEVEKIREQVQNIQ